MAESTGKEKGCIFCQIVAGDLPCYRIYEDELSLAILRHVPWWHELSDDENASLFKVAKVVAEKMMIALEPDFVCMYARGRRIPHTHIFLVPTYQGDILDRFFNALELFQESPPELAALREKDSMEDIADLLREADPKKSSKSKDYSVEC
jgi:histidine triad (HIT) family protein